MTCTYYNGLDEVTAIIPKNHLWRPFNADEKYAMVNETKIDNPDWVDQEV